MAEWFAKLKADFILNFIKEDRWKLLVDGLGVTLTVTFFALLIGVVIGIVLAAVRSTYDTNYERMHNPFARAILKFFNALCRIYITVIRGTPVVVQLLILFFVMFVSSNNKVMVAALSFGFNSGAYVAEIIRGGIMSIDAGQMEAGRSLGLQLFADDVLHHPPADDQKRAARAGQRVHRPAEGDVRRRLRRRAGSDQGRAISSAAARSARSCR